MWLNGKAIATFTGYFPFEADLDGLRKGRNTLVVKVSSLRSSTDLTHWRPAAFNGFGTGGWWNFGGLLREVYVRRIDTIDIEDVHVLPRLPKVGGPAKVEVRAQLRNLTSRDEDVALAWTVERRALLASCRDRRRQGHARAQDALHDRQAAPVAAGTALPLRHDGGGPGGGPAPGRVPAALRRAQARRASAAGCSC